MGAKCCGGGSSSERETEQKLEAIEDPAIKDDEAGITNGETSHLSQEQVKVLTEEITSNYDEVLKKRQTINDSLRAFKVALKLPEDADIPTCFNTVKNTAGLSAKIEVARINPLQLRVDEDSWKDLSTDLKDAIIHFNSMLRSCYELLLEKERMIESIQGYLQKLEALSADISELKDIPVRITEFLEEVESLLGEINAALYFFGDDSFGFMPTGP